MLTCRHTWRKRVTAIAITLQLPVELVQSIVQQVHRLRASSIPRAPTCLVDMLPPLDALYRGVCLRAGHHTTYETIAIHFVWREHQIICVAPSWRCQVCKDMRTHVTTYVHTNGHLG